MLLPTKNYREFNSYDLLKVIAISTMVIDHLGLFLFQDIELLRVIGRIAFPLFIFCVGYNLKYSFDRTLFVLAVIMLCMSFIFCKGEYLYYRIFGSSVLFAIIFVRFCLAQLIPILNSKNIVCITIILWAANFVIFQFIQYGTSGIILGLCGYLIRQDSKLVENKSLYILLNLILYACFNGAYMRYSLFGWLLLSLEVIILYKMMVGFSIKDINIKGKNIFKFIARNSLIIYFVHYEIFALLALYKY